MPLVQSVTGDRPEFKPIPLGGVYEPLDEEKHLQRKVLESPMFDPFATNKDLPDVFFALGATNRSLRDVISQTGPITGFDMKIVKIWGHENEETGEWWEPPTNAHILRVTLHRKKP